MSADALGGGAIFFLFAISGIVLAEPAPFDLLVVAFAVLFFVCGLRMPAWMAPPFVLLVVYVVLGFIGATQTNQFADSAKHVIVTGYLSLLTFFAGCLVASDPKRWLRVIFRGYAVAAVIAAIAGIIGYFSLLDGAYEIFTENGRARGTFKDPNVFGPFFVPPALYAFYRICDGRGPRSLFWAFIFVLATVCILLSFSRGAWGHYAVSFVMCLILLFVSSSSARLKGRVALAALVTFALGTAALVAMLSLDSVSDLLQVRGQLLQDYDVGATFGRLAGQMFALDKILSYPLGLGAPGFEIMWGQAPHNVYLHGFLISGWLGGWAYVVLVMTTFACGLRTILLPSPVQGIAIVVFSCFVGVAALGFLIDTDHWRHFYLLTGLIWGLYAAQHGVSQAGVRP